MLDFGETAIIDTVTRNIDGIIDDPIGLTFSYSDPDGLPAAGNKGNADTPYVYGTNAEIVRDSLGHFHILIPGTKAGAWSYLFTTLDANGDAVGISEGSFEVKAAASRFDYCTISDIYGRITEPKLIQLTDFGNQGFADISKVNDCISSAGGIIDSYCGGRYSLPLIPTAQIKDAAISITIYKLHSLRQIAPEKVRVEFEDAIAYLKDVSAGRATLNQDSKTQVGTTESVRRDHVSDPEAFDNTRLEAYIG